MNFLPTEINEYIISFLLPLEILNLEYINNNFYNIISKLWIKITTKKKIKFTNPKKALFLHLKFMEEDMNHVLIEKIIEKGGIEEFSKIPIYKSGSSEIIEKSKIFIKKNGYVNKLTKLIYYEYCMMSINLYYYYNNKKRDINFGIYAPINNIQISKSWNSIENVNFVHNIASSNDILANKWSIEDIIFIISELILNEICKFDDDTYSFEPIII